MNHFKKIYFLLKAIANQFKQWFLELPKIWKAVVIAIIVVLLFLLFKFLTAEKKVEDVIEKPRRVTLATVSDLSANNSPIPVVGVVTSVSEAVIRTESSGKLTRVYKKLGDRVYAGETIASFENSGERASVLQAEGVYESAKAARDIALINSATTNANIGDIRTNALNTVTNTYATLDDVIRGKTDVAFSDARFATARLKFSTSDSILQSKVEQQRIAIETMLVEREARNRTLSTDTDFTKELASIQSEVQTIKNYLDDLSSAYAKSIPSQDVSQATLDGQKAVVSGVRSTIAATLSTIYSAKTSFTSGLAAQEIAGRTTGDKNPNSASADASVKTALGSYNSALSRLEKTIIRSPITGTLNSLSIETGDFVGQSTQVAVVSNNGALEVLVYVTEDDAKRISIGTTAIINSTIKAVVTRVASAIDPVTKKIEVRIGILDDKTQVINGESVRVELSSTPKKSEDSALELIKIPLSAVKITPRGSYVFTLSASSTLISVPVETGTLLGEEIQIISGLSGDMIIVRDARGLKEGNMVDVNIATSTNPTN